MSKISLDLQMIKKMREDEKTWTEISNELNVSMSTLTRFSRKNKLKLNQEYQVGKRMCDKCRHFYNIKDLRSNVHGEFCKHCYQYTCSQEVKYGSPVVRDSDCEIQ